MRLLIVLFIITGLAACKQEAALPLVNSTVIEVKGQASWQTERLDDTYVIQFPSDYKGGIGPTIEGPEFSLVRNDQRVYFLGAGSFSGAALPLPTPLPERIDLGNVTLNRLVTLRRDGQTQGLFYYAEQPKTWGRLYLLKDGQFGYSMTVQYNIELHREVLGILQTIQPR